METLSALGGVQASQIQEEFTQQRIGILTTITNTGATAHFKEPYWTAPVPGFEGHQDVQDMVQAHTTLKHRTMRKEPQKANRTARMSPSGLVSESGPVCKAQVQWTSRHKQPHTHTNNSGYDWNFKF